MRFAMFYHSLVSDWNHGNAHFLRGIATELQSRGHEVMVYQPRNGWSLMNLSRENSDALRDFYSRFPHLLGEFYDRDSLDLDAELDGVDVVIVHEWNEPELVSAIGRHRSQGGNYALLFHDTHHRSVTALEEMSQYELQDYDGVLAFGDVIRNIYLDNGWTSQAWTWHEAADTTLFRPLEETTSAKRDDLVWIGNWGDDERSVELRNYFIEPARRLKLKAAAYGVRYPDDALRALSDAEIEFRGWVPNFRVPEVFADSSMTVHIPRRPYREQLPGIPTIRVFEALACGIPLACLHWEDSEHLFRPGEDYLQADTPGEMVECLYSIQTDKDLAERLSKNGLETILARHTCGHRVDELLEIVGEVRGSEATQAASAAARQRRGTAGREDIP